jgi:hypothetical protein
LKAFVIEGGCKMRMPASAVPPIALAMPVALAVYVNVVEVGVPIMVENCPNGVL